MSGFRIDLQRFLALSWSICVVAVMAAAGCSDDTGIVIEISQDTAKVTAPTSLEFHIGVAGDIDLVRTAIPQCNSNANSKEWFVATGNVVAERTATLDKDIARTPYRLLLHPGEVDSDARLMVVVIGKKGDSVVSAGQLAEPVTFVAGKTVRWNIELTDSDSIVSRNGCVCGPAGAIVPPEDSDCDKVVGDADCAPERGDVHPGALEICDGYDNDCNPATIADKAIDCYVKDADSCFHGIAQCSEDVDAHTVQPGVCTRVDDDPVSSLLCDHFETCRTDSNPFECANSKGEKRELSCEFLVADNGERCAGRAVLLRHQEPPADPNTCEWVLLGGTNQTSYLAGLLGTEADTILRPRVATCNAILHVNKLNRSNGEIPDVEPLRLYFSADGPENYEIWEFFIAPKSVSRCPADPVLQPGLRCDGLTSIATALDML